MDYCCFCLRDFVKETLQCGCGTKVGGESHQSFHWTEEDGTPWEFSIYYDSYAPESQAPNL